MASLQLVDGTELQYEGDLGQGTFSIVTQFGPFAWKTPKVMSFTGLNDQEREDTEYINDINREALNREKVVYNRIGNCDAIAECIQTSEEGILLSCYKQGDLESYIENHKSVEESQKATWILSAIKALAHLHAANILVFDIAPRNYLLADDDNDLLSLKMIDFGQATVFPPDVDISTANEDGMTAKVDIFHLGCVIYSIAVWERFEYDLMEHDYEVPLLENLPTLDGCFCAELIRKCWLGEYPSAKELYAEALNTASLITDGCVDNRASAN